MLRRQGKIDQAVQELSSMLDTFYTEVEGWIELADLYNCCHQYVFPVHLTCLAKYIFRYAYALQSLSHALLLAPQNPFHFLQFAETAYLALDIPLSLKMYLQVVDMTDDDDEDLAPIDSIPTGITLRAWLGVKLVSVHSFPLVDILNVVQPYSVPINFSQSLAWSTHHPRRPLHQRHRICHLSMNYQPNDFGRRTLTRQESPRRKQTRLSLMPWPRSSSRLL